MRAALQQLRLVVSKAFYEHHLLCVEVLSAAETLNEPSRSAKKEIQERAKKHAEVMFQTRRRRFQTERRERGLRRARRIRANTLLIIGRKEAYHLAREIESNQEVFRQREIQYVQTIEQLRRTRVPDDQWPDGPLYETHHLFPYYEREDQRASFCGCAHLQYAVDENPDQTCPGRFLVCHREDMAAQRTAHHHPGSQLLVVR